MSIFKMTSDGTAPIEEFAGRVLAVHHTYIGDGLYSDDASVWDDAEIKGITFAGGYGPTNGHAEVDASPAIAALAYAYLVETSIPRRVNAIAQTAVYDAQRVMVGRECIVSKGRKVKVGTVGTCFWVGESTYGMRAGLKVNGETVWTALDNLDVVDPWDYLPTIAELTAAARIECEDMAARITLGAR